MDSGELLREIHLKALAKINLGLDVTGKRPNGYHDLRMVMQTVTLYDRITISRTVKKGIRLKTNLGFLPTGSNNLAYRAAQMLIDEFGVGYGVFINLDKHIPVAAGLAGGSSDAAAVLVGVNKLFNLGLSMQELQERGVKLGADVPYCIQRGTALAEGIGEVLTPLPGMPDCSIILVKPPVHVSTAFVYGNLKLDEVETHPDIDAQVEALRAGDLARTAELCGNVLESVTVPAYPQIQALKDTLMRGGALQAMMSGSGPTVFGIFDDHEKAQAVFRKLKNRTEDHLQVFLTRPYNNHV